MLKKLLIILVLVLLQTPADAADETAKARNSTHKDVSVTNMNLPSGDGFSLRRDEDLARSLYQAGGDVVAGCTGQVRGGYIDESSGSDATALPADAFRFKYSRNGGASGGNGGKQGTFGRRITLMKDQGQTGASRSGDLPGLASVRLLNVGGHSLKAGLYARPGTAPLSDYPVPALLYEYSADRFTLTAGYPYASAGYHLNDKMSVNVSMFQSKEMMASLEYRVSESFLAALEGGYEKRVYLRPEYVGRLGAVTGYERKKAGIRLTKQFMDALSVYGFIGYSFDGEYTRHEDGNQDKSVRTPFDDAALLNIGAQFRF